MSMTPNPQPATVLARVKLLVFDVDGVLTDGSIFVDDDGRSSRRFHVRDGFAMVVAQQVGLKIGVISGKASRAVTLRMTELNVGLLVQGVSQKGIALETVCQQAGVMPEEAAFVGDDLVDLPAMMRCGYPIAVADAVAQALAVAQFRGYITQAPGGRGAAREAIEHILKAQGKWDEIVDRYEGEGK